MFTRIHPVVARLTSVMAVLSVVGGGGVVASYLTSHPARAQGQTAPASAQPSKDVQELQTALDDLDALHVLLPLKLTAEQMDKIAAAITSAKTEYDKQYAALSNGSLLKMADEIRETRKKAIAGTPVPAAFDTRIQGLQAELNTKRVDMDTKNLVALSGVIKPILTADQIAICAKLEVDAYKRNKRYNEKTTDAQFFNAYVLDVFISNPRAVTLLKEMRASKGDK